MNFAIRTSGLRRNLLLQKIDQICRQLLFVRGEQPMRCIIVLEKFGILDFLRGLATRRVNGYGFVGSAMNN
jgi:hypothetical protein